MTSLVLDGYKHKRINHSKEYSNGRGTHVNGIENFWSFAKRRLAKFNGVSRKTFLLHLKECEFRYNNKDDILKTLKRIIKSLLVQSQKLLSISDKTNEITYKANGIDK